MSSQTLSVQDGGAITISVRVPRENYDKLNELARNDQRSISNLVNVLISKHINQE